MDSPDDPPEREPLLDDHAIEAIARRVTQLLRHDPVAAAHERLVPAAEIARRFGVSRAWVYENADRLGAVRLGRGARPRLRFDQEKVEKRLETAHERASPGPRRQLGDEGRSPMRTLSRSESSNARATTNDQLRGG